MCTGMEKLRRSGDQTAIELARVKKQLAQATKEKEAAENQSKSDKYRCMCLTRNADTSNMIMIFTTIALIVNIGLRIYEL